MTFTQDEHSNVFGKLTPIDRKVTMASGAGLRYRARKVDSIALKRVGAIEMARSVTKTVNKE
jgi:hypothetical protein